MISHGEGRFIAPDHAIESLFRNGQVATQYVDCDGNSDSYDSNPNGSICSIEGITSPDGRILGKMGHSERKGDYIGINIQGEKDQKIFEAGGLFQIVIIKMVYDSWSLGFLNLQATFCSIYNNHDNLTCKALI